MSNQPSEQEQRKLWIQLLSIVIVWLAVVTAGFLALFAYGFESGPTGDLRNLSPQSASGKWQLVMAVHPKCACTNATYAELERLLRHVGKETDCQILVFEPEDSVAFSDTQLLARFKSIPGVKIQRDPGGVQALSLGMTTSGCLAVWDPKGSPRFFGGITASRGHEGMNAGSNAVANLILHRSDGQVTHRVFGCPIQNHAMDSDHG
ncbi:MAG: hypothetical protein AAFV88_00030 [Planctomycetota bacterium]